ncbi:hypothetical protein JCM1841_002455 [Sporobolomyces salmonicolor]
MLLHLFLFALLSLSPVAAQIVWSPSPSSCLGAGSLVAPSDQQLNFTSVYAQFDQGQTSPGQHAYGVNLENVPPVFNSQGARLTGTGDILRIVLTGSTIAESQGYSNDTSYLSTLVIDSEVLTFEVASNQSALCSSIRTNEGTTGTMTNGSSVVTDSGCPYSGEIALGFTVPLTSSYALTTITTSLVALDPSVPALHLACYDLSFTPYYPDYFAYPLVRYVAIGILALYLLLYVLARFYAAYTSWLQDNEAQLASSLTLKITSTYAPSKRQMWGSIWFSAWAGKQILLSGSLRRYMTAELREIFATVAWFSLVGTVAVDWPGFAYPVFSQTAWTTLIYKNTLSFTSPSDPVLPQNATLPSAFSAQMTDLDSPLYLDTGLPNVLLDLEGSRRGIEKWARMIGVRHEDVWSVCAFTFFCICAGVIAVHALFFAFDSLLDAVLPSRPGGRGRQAGEMKPPLRRDERSSFSVQKEGLESYSGRPSDGSMGRFLESGEFADEDYLDDSAEYGRPRPEDNFPSWRLHLALLQGNLTRVLLLFHLPLTAFSVYQFTLHSISPTSTFALAIVTFAVVCIAWPAHLLWQIHVKPERELYASLPVLLSTGVIYNTYAEECCLFPLVTFGSSIIVGILIGAAQSEGTAQAAVILLVEVASTICQSLWLPWGDNAAMGPLAFLLSLARIIIAVLLIVLSPTVGVSASAASWVTYIIFLCQGLVILLLLSVLAFKLSELLVRIAGRVPFDESRSPRGGGFFGALRKLDRVRGGKKRRSGGTRSGAAGGVAKRRAVEERRRRNLHRERLAATGSAPSETTVGTRTHMLPAAAPPGHRSQASSLSANAPYPSAAGLVDDDGFIMSAMSSIAWSDSQSSRPGYVKPGAYASSSAGGPVLRDTPAAWGEHHVTLVPAAAAVPSLAKSSTSTTSSGFTRVGGGRATQKNPYELANPPAATTAYPPYPPSSADLYGSRTTTTSSTGNPRRLSQSAIVEMAGANAARADSPPDPRHNTRPSVSLPSSSALLSNTVSQYSSNRIDEDRRAAGATKQKSGFFGRFKKRRVEMSDDEFTDDTDDTDDERRPAPRQWGGLKLGGWALPGRGRRGRGRGRGDDDGSADEAPAPSEVAPPETGEKGFSVVRKPRPRPSPAGSGGAAAPTAPAAPATESRAIDFAAADAQQQDEPPAGSGLGGSEEPLLRSSSSPSLPPGAAPPHVSVEAPSRPGSLRGEAIGEEWEEQR